MILPFPLAYHMLVLTAFIGSHKVCDYGIAKITKQELVQKYNAQQVKGQ